MTDVQNDLEGEVWGDIPDLEGYYQVSTLGRVRSLDRVITWYRRDIARNVSKDMKGKIMKIKTNNHGYCVIHLRKDQEDFHVSIHRLVARTFIPNPENKPCVNHMNGVKTDNRLENLEWCTISENTKHSIVTGLYTPPDISLYQKRGETHPNSVVNDDKVRQIRKMREEGMTLMAIADVFGISFSNVDRICRRLNWKHVE